ncbi:MAG: secondary thiamine-phosphate synthase enzyme YjbQ [Methylococcales bacterium]|jgi:secondary thiamine-phosphate synthase enzyme|nr:secondary thiamine-phosphate synthase enzyme YjbQ [Methylococcales bacterium]
MGKPVWVQKEIGLKPKVRGFHLVSSEVLKQLPELQVFAIGVAHFFLQHTSASITVSENADPSVRDDLESSFNQLAPESAGYYTHVFEGADDMPAHVKTVLIGNNLTLPIGGGRLLLGLWQGLYLCEHRNHASGRVLIVTLNGEGFENEYARKN